MVEGERVGIMRELAGELLSAEHGWFAAHAALGEEAVARNYRLRCMRTLELEGRGGRIAIGRLSFGGV